MNTVGILLQDIIASMPLLALGGGILIMMLVEAVLPKVNLGVVGLLITVAVITITVFSPSYSLPAGSVFGGMLAVDDLSTFGNILLLICTGVALIYSLRAAQREGVEKQGEYYILMLLSTFGAMIFANSNELILLFVGLEIMSISLYGLCGSALMDRASSESALKYFMLGAFGSAVMLYGIALIYGATGSLMIDEISKGVAEGKFLTIFMLLSGISLLIFGFGFKLGLAPFHFWIPDVYQGAPTPVTAYMATAVKVSAVIAVSRVLLGGFSSDLIYSIWSDFLWLIAVLTMCIGNFIAVRQTNVKRLLAYSSIAHAGYMAVGLLAGHEGVKAVLFYLCAYMLLTLGAFGVLLAGREPTGAVDRRDDLSRFNGLGIRCPFVGIVMAICLFGLAGLPPGFAGFVGKFGVFSAAIREGYLGLVVIAAVNSAISCYYYFKVLVAMYFNQVEGGGEMREFQRGKGYFALFSLVLAVCAFGGIILGIYPSGILTLAGIASSNLF